MYGLYPYAIAVPFAAALVLSAAVAYVAGRKLWFVVGLLGATAGYLLCAPVGGIDPDYRRHAEWAPHPDLYWRRTQIRFKQVAVRAAWMVIPGALIALALPVTAALSDRLRTNRLESRRE